MKRIPSTILFVLCINVAVFSQHHGYKSWMPAAQWEDALRTGNGSIGALVFGYPFEETIIVNHAELFLPGEKPVEPPNMAPYLDTIRKLSLEGNFGEAALLGKNLWVDAYGPKKWTDPYVPAADVLLSMPASNVIDYHRSVNYRTAETLVNWDDETGSYSRKTFASRADDVLVTHIEGTTSMDVDVQLRLHPYAWEQYQMIQERIEYSETTSDGDLLIFHCRYGQAHSHSAKGYYVVSKVIVEGDSCRIDDHKFCVTKADKILILTSISPYFEESSSDSILEGICNHLNQLNPSYRNLLERQIETHGELYDRVELILEDSLNTSQMTSETLVNSAKRQYSPSILQRQFEASRYNILCSTGIHPPNLQGIWSGTWTPPWSADFTHDGNVQVAISNLLNGNMTELMESYFNHHERLMDDYRMNAKKLYGTRGIHIPSHTSNHGYNNHYDETWCMEFWNGGAGWAASYFFDYYVYTQDVNFLKTRAFPFMTEALLFWEDFLIEDDEGKYIVVPSYSPENNPKEHRWQNCINACMDVSIISELIQNWIVAARVLGVSEKDILEKTVMLNKLPEFEVSEDGVFKEWLQDGFTDRHEHRHASQLYGVYEVPNPLIMASEDFQVAIRETIHRRMEIRKQQQGGEMAFGMCHLAFAAINMNEPEIADEILSYLSKYYWTKGMATTHNPGHLFNMDISGGIPSLMIRMVVNSEPGRLHFFQGKPEAWDKGQLKGACARGAIDINLIDWNEERADIKFLSKIDQHIVIDFGGEYDVHTVKSSSKQILIDNEHVEINLVAGELVEMSILK